ncbi:MAG: HEAT repeat domain-containing protein [Treponema sp.]|jgi:outer membrane protein assembly factor BamB|nr:HEAT repeat domain-containing protein [Treponema sp.]
MIKGDPGKTTVFLILFGTILAGRIPAETAEGIFPKENAGAAVPVWRQAPGGVLLGVPTIQAGSVVAVLDGGHLKAYSLEGRPLWDYYARFRLIPYVTRTREGTCYICRTDGILISVNRAGRELWRKKTGAITAPVIAGWDGRIFVTTGGRIRCYTAAGYLLWTWDTDETITAGPFLTRQGGLAAALGSGELLELDPFGRAAFRSIGEVPSTLVPAAGGILALLKSGDILYFRAGSPEVPAKPLAKLRGIPLGGASRENLAAILLANGQVTQISLSNGKRQWNAGSHIAAVQSPAEVRVHWDDRGIYVFSAGGATGFSGEGKRAWLFRLGGASSIPALSDEGTLFSGGADWILYAYKLENRVLPPGQSLYGPAPEGNYGLANPPPSPWGRNAPYFSEAQVGEELQRLNTLIQEGRVGEDEMAYAAYLRELGGSSVNPQTSKTHPPLQVKQRAEAVRLLGFIGSRETIPFLTGLYLRDPDSAVKTAAAAAIGRIGVDPDGTALQAFRQTITAANQDEQVLVATAGAIGALCRFAGPPLSDAGIRLLGTMESSFMPAAARAQARRETASLR